MSSFLTKGLRLLAALSLAAAAMLAVSLPAAGQTADDQDGTGLPDSYLDGYGWWNKGQQNPAGGRFVDPPGCSAYPPGAVTGPAPTVPSVDPRVPPPNTAPAGQCPAGAPADGLYIAYDYESVTPTAVTGAVSNTPPVPTVPVTSPSPLVPTVNPPDQVLGPTAYAAVRFGVPDDAETSLDLQVLNRPTSTPGGIDPTSSARVSACQITTPGWAALQNDRYDQGPKWDPASCSVGQLSGDTMTWEFPATMVDNGTLDVAIVPSFGGCNDAPVTTPSTTAPPSVVPQPKCDHPFQLAFAKPTNYSLSILSVPEDDEELGLDAEYGDFEDPLATFEDDYGDALDPDSAFASFDYAGAGVDQYGAISGAPVPRPQVNRAVPASGFRNPFRPDASRGERLLAVSLLLAMGAALWWFGGQQLRAPRLLGSLGAGVIPGDDRERDRDANRGLGRFVRPRSGRPPRLF